MDGHSERPTRLGISSRTGSWCDTGSGRGEAEIMSAALLSKIAAAAVEWCAPSDSCSSHTDGDRSSNTAVPPPVSCATSIRSHVRRGLSELLEASPPSSGVKP